MKKSIKHYPKKAWDSGELDVAFRQVLKLPNSPTKTKLLRKIWVARFGK